MLLACAGDGGGMGITVNWQDSRTQDMAILLVYSDSLMLRISACRMLLIFRSTLRLSRPNKAGLKCLSVLMYVHTCVHTSVHPQNVSSISMKLGM